MSDLYPDLEGKKRNSSPADLKIKSIFKIQLIRKIAIQLRAGLAVKKPRKKKWVFCFLFGVSEENFLTPT